MARPSLSTTLPTARLLLRAPRTSDVPALGRALVENADHLRPWSPESAQPPSLVSLTQQVTAQRRAWRDDRRYVLLVTDVTTGAVVGRVALGEVVRGAFESAHLGYWIDHRVVGRGLMTEAVRAALAFALGPLGLHRVQAAILPENTPSLRVAAKAGLREEGLARRYLKIAGRWQDHRIFAITAEEIM
ncbi:MAG: GNAT family N-acetyltransferase [Polyangiaceae bacterium]|nr:GNAT family N-acetyltransferase [Polyangiaceae bacterium]